MAENQASGHTLAARQLMRRCNRVTLGTRLLEGGRPYVSLAAVATDTDGSPLFLFSQLSDHTKNLGADPQLSMLFDGTEGFTNPQEGSRATVMGRIERVNGESLERVKRRYFARHPGAAMYADFADFGFYRAAIERIHWVGGFGKAAWLERHLTVDAATAASFAVAEPDLLMRFAKRADRIAASRLKRAGKGWTLAAVDPDGCDLLKGKRSERVAFEAPLDSPDQVEAALKRV